LIEIIDLSYTYPGTTTAVLQDVNLTIGKGEFVSIMGPTGAGKTTLCLTLNGLIPHSLGGEVEGDVEILGMNTKYYPTEQLATKVSMVFQEPEGQLFCMSVEEEVAFGPENLGLPREEIRKRVDWALEAVRMKDFIDRFPMNLSGGQKQRVCIAAALSMRPEILVLDEPTSGLDPIGKMEVFSVVRDLKDKYDMTILMVENESERVAEFSDRVVLMSEGKIVLDGSPRQVLVDNVSTLEQVGILPPQVSELSQMLNSGTVARRKYSFLNLDEAKSGITEILASPSST
jgi:energy-coupling factor transporter ATP-binding protein EcfA2